MTLFNPRPEIDALFVSMTKGQDAPQPYLSEGEFAKEILARFGIGAHAAAREARVPYRSPP